MRRIGVLGTLLVVVCALCGLFASAAMAETEAQEITRGRELGIRAYIYGQPLLDTERIFNTSTSVNVATESGYAPVNQFSHFKHLVTTNESVVVAPNDDTLYATGWLEMKKNKPMVVNVPSASRFDVVEMVSPWTENFANVGTEASGILPPGQYLVAGPGTDEGKEELEGLKIIHSPYNRVWLIGRVVVEGPTDTEALPIEEEMKIVPLKNWLKEGLSYTPKAPTKEDTEPNIAHVPGTAEGESPLLYWKALGKALKQFAPPEADKPILKELAAVHIGPGKKPSKGNDGKGVVRGLEEAVTAGPIQVLLDVKEAYLNGFAKHNGWLVTGAGSYGTNYVMRAEVDRLGVGALSPNVSIYPLSLTDDTTAKLNGASKRYVVHFPASDFPFPVKAFWSLTMYEASGFFVSNPLERYALGNRSQVHYNEDGSLNIYLQTAEPSGAQQKENWLPTPAGEFHLVVRLYATEPQDIEPILEGTGSWQTPLIEPCLESGSTAGGQECPS
jgi:hypothetical protein